MWAQFNFFFSSSAAYKVSMRTRRNDQDSYATFYFFIFLGVLTSTSKYCFLCLPLVTAVSTTEMRVFQ